MEEQAATPADFIPWIAEIFAAHAVPSPRGDALADIDAATIEEIMRRAQECGLRPPEQ